MLRQSLEKTIQAKLGSLLARDAFEDFRKRVDYTEYGGAPLLGVKGVCLISHGKSNSNAIKNAVRVAAELSRGRINQRIEETLSESLKTSSTLSA
jgi:glycerol-3-phosphate acyltransferase PlsX